MFPAPVSSRFYDFVTHLLFSCLAKLPNLARLNFAFAFFTLKQHKGQKVFRSY